ncbi:hypothetical protein CROQUDRAFT_96516 [Cronartium quercuum f. sp. fusiforme G11]|uniref:Uncharacterized protein n=1 Tax=Cronartium quercuum f. sp. fusiforme G11 TaxID=708437 RepID=A0A9P6NFV6_9BASI|nr:hypothetical protein CROQUDRAFT_96516 [Cronartium quercuum f. sp. fusiforme G11]
MELSLAFTSCRTEAKEVGKPGSGSLSMVVAFAALSAALLPWIPTRLKITICASLLRRRPGPGRRRWETDCI